MNRMKPAATRPSTPCTRATMSSGRLREKAATASPHRDSISTHSSSEPSWPPHTPAMRYSRGSRELECWAT